IILKSHAFIDGNVVLNLHPVPYRGIRTDDDVLPDLAGFSDFGPFKNVRHMPDARPLTDCYPLVNECRIMSKPLTGRFRNSQCSITTVFSLESCLRLLQHGEDAKAFLAVRARTTTGSHGLQKV